MPRRTPKAAERYWRLAYVGLEWVSQRIPGRRAFPTCNYRHTKATNIEISMRSPSCLVHLALSPNMCTSLDQGNVRSGIRDLSRSQSFTRQRRFTRSHPNKLISAQKPNIIPLLAFLLALLDVRARS